MHFVTRITFWLCMFAASVVPSHFVNGQNAIRSGSTAPTTRDAIPRLVTFPAGVDHIELPLTRAGVLVGVNVTVDGTPIGWFGIDTGASGTFIDKVVAEKLRLKHVRSMGIAGISKTTTEDVVAYETLDVGPVTMRHGIAVAGDLSLVDVRSGFKVAGFLGSDLLREQPFTIDFPAATLTLYRKDTFVPPKLAAEPMVVWGGLPTIRGRVEGHDGRFVLDSGSTFALTFDVDFLRQHYSAMPGTHISQSGSSVGFNAPVNSYTATFNDIEVLGRHFRIAWQRMPHQT